MVTNLNADLLDGNHASAFLPVGGTATNSSALGGLVDTSWARIFPTNSGVANAGGSGVNLLGSTSTGIAGAYVGTSGTTNIVTSTVQTTSPSDIRLKEEIADTDLGLAFVERARAYIALNNMSLAKADIQKALQLKANVDPQLRAQVGL